MKRKRLTIRGIVQGVGFRPFVYRNAVRLGLAGWVSNTPEGVVLEIEGENVNQFVDGLRRNSPPLARIVSIQEEDIPLHHSSGFHIRPSRSDGQSDVQVSPDIVICPLCQQEMNDPSNRRFRYPFINCTDCGPRYTIIRLMPYDRPATTMEKFAMCPQCREEYQDPSNRRYHAQPISCFSCGPRLHFITANFYEPVDPLSAAVELLRSDGVIAVKGIGGYHLACRALSDRAVLRLRQKKRREEKPLALMGTPAMIERECECSPEEKEWLMSSAAPIVLLRKKHATQVSSFVAEGQQRFGFMVPYSPLHALLVDEVGEPLIMTSANDADEPILYESDREKLFLLADGVLDHDRPIEVFTDDSVVQFLGREPHFIRRSRGYVPLNIDMAWTISRPILALGAMLKGTFTFFSGNRALVSPYIATLSSPQSLEAEKRLIDHYRRLFHIQPEVIAVDKHPAYPNRLLTAEFPQCRVEEIQHHHAHIAAVLAENGENGPVIGMALDGTGYGDDGTVWGGECFTGGLFGFSRIGHLRPAFLPSGELAVLQPWRFALSLLWEMKAPKRELDKFYARFADTAFHVLSTIEKRIAGVMTTSLGRFFDAVAVLLELGWRNDYDGQLPAMLQGVAETAAASKREYSFSLTWENEMLVLDFLPLLQDLLEDKESVEEKAAAVHRTLAAGLARMAEEVRDRSRLNTIALSGGVLQNLFFLSELKKRLDNSGFRVLLHRHVPCNDSGVSLGQAVLAGWRYREGSQ